MNIELQEEEIIIPDINYVVFRQCNPSWRLSPHMVSNFDITYLIHGRARYTIDNIKHELSAGDILSLPESVKKEAVTYSSNLMHCFSVNFQPKNMDMQTAKLSLPMVSHIGIRNDLIRLFDDLVYTWRERQPGYMLKCRGLLLLVLHSLLEATVFGTFSSDRDSRIKTAVMYIARNYAKPLSVKKLAAKAGLNTAYFGVLFKQVTGLKVNQYIANVRIHNAKTMLESGAYRVSEAAEHCGYNDAFHFYKQFKHITGLPPSRYIPKISE
ncbi:MAG: AraC family transcriptional regulator [Treponema sp.]|jgi:AraC-like DNA-binding protein|nr:AraC family transcriptional regulator [Treponema sp.]